MKSPGNDHPTIKSPEQGLAVLRRFSSEFQAPTIDEGFDRIFYLSSLGHTYSEYSKADIAALLNRIGGSTAAPSIVTLEYNRNTSNWNTNSRGRGGRHNNKFSSRQGRAGSSRSIRTYFQNSLPYQPIGKHSLDKSLPNERGRKGKVFFRPRPNSHLSLYDSEVSASSSSAEKSSNGTLQDPIILE